MQIPLNLLRNLVLDHDPLPLARALLHQPVYARAVLALELGLTDTLEASAVLRSVQSFPVVSPLPPPPALSHDGRAMWLRLLTASLLSRLDAPTQGSLSLLDGGSLDPRLAQAHQWASSLGRPLVYAVRDWSVVQETQLRQNAAEVVTLEEAVLTLTARSKSRLNQLAQWTQGALVLDDLHTFDPRGFPALERLLGAAAEQGMHLAITGSFPHPLHEHLPGEPAQTGFEFHAAHQETADIIAALDETTPTLLLMPSRRAALELHSHLPTALLTTRTKTVHHLSEEAAVPAHRQIATWGSVPLNRNQYPRIITTRMPWPVLADAALATTRLDLFPITTWKVPAALTTPQSLTDDLLQSGDHPLDPASHHTYWTNLEPFIQDTLDIQRSTAELNFAEINHKFRQLFQGGVTVLVQQPGAEQDIARARRNGRLPISRYTAIISHSSLKKATEAGWIEEAGQALIWTGPYTQDLGVNMA